MSISEIVLFYSSTSPESTLCRKGIRSIGIKIKEVRLDTIELREKAERNKTIKITHVPSLLVKFEDGEDDTIIFIGRPKIINWLTELVSSQRENNSQETIEEPEYKSSSLYDDPNPREVSKQTFRSPPKIYRPEPLEDIPEPVYQPEPLEDFSMLEPVAGSGFDREEPQEDQGLYSGVSKGKKGKKKKKKIEEPSEGIELQFSGRPPPPATDGLSTGPSSKKGKGEMKDIKSLAKQMEKDMENARGYKEKDLPSYN